MKKITILFIAGLFISFITSCKNDTKSDNQDESVNPDSTIIEDVVPKTKILNPEDVDENTPVPVADLKKAAFIWNGKEVTVIGYCDVMFSYGTVKDEVKLFENPDSSKKLVYCELKEEYNGDKVEETTPIVIKGKIKGHFFDGVSMVDCEIVSVGGEIKPNAKLCPDNITDEPIFVADLHKAYFAWNEKTVSVIGYYKSTTTSTTSYGTTIRVDLADPNTKETAVGCRMKEKPKEDLANNRNDVVIKGIIRGDAFGNVLMEECELVH